MKRILLTGMSGTGKSTLIVELAARGYQAIDLDSDEWSEWADYDWQAGETPLKPGKDWVWQEDRVRALLSTEEGDVLFVSGCARNQGKLYPRFDHIILLSAPAEVIAGRLAMRTNNPYGKHPDELARVLELIQTIEPLLRRSAGHEIDTSAPLDEVVARVLGVAR